VKEGIYLLNKTMKKIFFGIFEAINDPTLVYKRSPKAKNCLMTCAKWAMMNLKTLIFAKCVIEFLD